MKERAFLATEREAAGLASGSITRIVRVVEPQPVTRLAYKWQKTCWTFWDGAWRYMRQGMDGVFYPQSDLSLDCPFGVPGGRLLVQEDWARIGTPNGPRVIHKAERVGALLGAIFDDEETGEGIEWQAASDMRRESCRTILDLTDVRGIRVQEMTGLDVKAAGVEPEFHHVAGVVDESSVFGKFREIIGEAIWDADKYVWLGTVKRAEER